MKTINKNATEKPDFIGSPQFPEELRRALEEELLKQVPLLVDRVVTTFRTDDKPKCPKKLLCASERQIRPIASNLKNVKRPISMQGDIRSKLSRALPIRAKSTANSIITSNLGAPSTLVKHSQKADSNQLSAKADASKHVDLDEEDKPGLLQKKKKFLAEARFLLEPQGTDKVLCQDKAVNTAYKLEKATQME